MIKIKLAIFLLAIIATVCTSCTKANNNTYTPPVVVNNNNNNNNNKAPVYYFTATINNDDAWSALAPTATSSSDTVTITGNDGTNQIVTIKFPSSLGVGKNYTSTYGIKEAYSLAGTSYNITANTMYLTISTINDTLVKGTCSFSGVSPINKSTAVSVSGGSFNLKL